MKAGSWASIIGVYLFAVAGGSTLSKILPLAGDFAEHFALQPSDFAWMVAALALPAAIFAIPSGIVVDRLGPRVVLLASGVIGIAANVLYWFADSLTIIYAARLLEGFGVVHMYTAGSALLIATTGGVKRTRAMTLWSTYAPVGTAVGLAMGGLYAETQGWRMTFVLHGALYAVALVIGLFQPVITMARSAKAGALSEKVEELFSSFGRPQLVALAIVFLMIISLGLGSNVTFPSYLAGVHNLSAGDAANMVASGTLMMVVGSAIAGFILPYGVRPAVFFTCLAVVGFIVGTLSFYPDISASMRMVPLIIWYVSMGASLSIIHSTLPVVADPKRPGAASALLTFAGALASFFNPPLWLGFSEGGDWRPFIALMAIGWGVAVLAILMAIRLAKADQARAEEVPA